MKTIYLHMRWPILWYSYYMYMASAWDIPTIVHESSMVNGKGLYQLRSIEKIMIESVCLGESWFELDSNEYNHICSKWWIVMAIDGRIMLSSSWMDDFGTQSLLNYWFWIKLVDDEDDDEDEHKDDEYDRFECCIHASGALCHVLLFFIVAGVCLFQSRIMYLNQFSFVKIRPLAGHVQYSGLHFIWVWCVCVCVCKRANIIICDQPITDTVHVCIYNKFILHRLVAWMNESARNVNDDESILPL